MTEDDAKLWRFVFLVTVCIVGILLLINSGCAQTIDSVTIIQDSNDCVLSVTCVTDDGQVLTVSQCDRIRSLTLEPMEGERRHYVGRQ